MKKGDNQTMAKKAKGARINICLACENEVDGKKCGQRNYDTEKNKKNNNERLEMNKYCRFCKKTTKHKETK